MTRRVPLLIAAALLALAVVSACTIQQHQQPNPQPNPPAIPASQTGAP